MVKEVTAFMADDGKVFPSELAALEHDAETALKRIEAFNLGTVTAILAHAKEISRVLQPLVEHRAEKVA